MSKIKYSSNNPKTLVAIKLPGSWVDSIKGIGLILLILSGLLFSVGSCQVYFCWDKTPKKTIKQCLLPQLYRIKK